MSVTASPHRALAMIVSVPRPCCAAARQVFSEPPGSRADKSTGRATRSSLRPSSRSASGDWPFPPGHSGAGAGHTCCPIPQGGASAGRWGRFLVMAGRAGIAPKVAADGGGRFVTSELSADGGDRESLLVQGLNLAALFVLQVAERLRQGGFYPRKGQSGP